MLQISKYAYMEWKNIELYIYIHRISSKSCRTSKSRRAYEAGSNKHRLQNLAAWKRVVGFKVRGMQAHTHDLHYRNGQVCRREAGEWTSRRPQNFAAGCSDLKLNLAVARFRGNTVYSYSSSKQTTCPLVE